MNAIGNATAYSPRRAMGQKQLLLLLLFITITFDFKSSSANGGRSILVLLGIANVIIGYLLIFNLRHIKKSVFILTLPFFIFLSIGIVSGLIRGQPIYGVIAQAIPLVIFLNAMIVTATYSRNRQELGSLLNTIVGFSLATATWKLFFALSYFGLDLETVRYQILSGATPILFAYAATGFLFQRRKLMLTAAIASLGLVAISVTRSYLVVFAVSGLALILVLPKRQIGKVALRLGGSSLVLIALIAIISIALPDVTHRWIIRLSSESRIGFDLTGATRLAEATYQIQQLKSSLNGLLFGFGMNAETQFAGPNVQLIQGVLGNKGIDYLGHGYGHVFYVGLFFVGGIFGATLVILGFLSILWQSAKTLRSASRKLSTEDQFAFALGFAATAGYLAYGFLGGTWGDRSLSFFFGISGGLALHKSTYLEPKCAQGAPNAPPTRS